MSTTQAEWLADLVAQARDGKALSAWMRVDTSPRLVIHERVATAEVVHALLMAMVPFGEGLTKGNGGLVPGYAPPAWVAEFRSATKETTRDLFMDALQERFHAAERPSADRWVYVAVAWLGGDRCAMRIGSRVRQAADDLNRAAANLGLEMLRTIGTDTAIMQLDMVARKVRRNSVKVRAQTALNEIAQQRQLTLDQLGDRIVPDCGLDAAGAKVFDFGPRQFTLIIASGLQLKIRDEGGQLRDELPKPRASDDPAKSAEAVAEWKLLKKSFKETLKLQADRLELAMILGREWSREEFRRLFAEHPVMRHLARQLVWGEYDASHCLLRSFRLGEDLTLSDEHDHALSEPLRVRVVHPLHLDAAARASWGQILSDYELLPPFEQINRSIHLPTAEESNLHELSRFNGQQVHAMSLLSKLTKLGWVCDAPGDGSLIFQHHKSHADGTCAVLRHYPGISIQSPADAEPQELNSCHFLRGTEVMPDCYQTLDGIPLPAVPPMIFSEVVRDLLLLTARG
jgi:hypothetical protein